MIQRILIGTSSLTKSLRFTYIQQWGQHMIKPCNIKQPQYMKKQLSKNRKLRLFPKVRANFLDALYMPGLDKPRLMDMQREVLQNGEITLSNQFIAMLMYHLPKNNLMLTQTMKIIQSWIPRHKGQYTSRQIFGCIHGMIIFNRFDYINFFLDQVKASELKFAMAEALEIVQALNINQKMTLQEKHHFWESNFKEAFVNDMNRVRAGNVANVIRIFDAFKQFQYFDEEIWDTIITLMDGKHGWARTTMIQRLYPLTGTFQKAKILFDKYYTKLSTNKNILWRYNLDELRLYSSQEMIGKSQQNIEMCPNFRTLLPEQKLQSITQRYDDWLINGAVKQQAQIIRDKSASFGFAIKDRFQSLSKDKVDFTKVSKTEFQELFGEYDENTMKDKPEGQEAQAQAQVEVEQTAETTETDNTEQQTK